MTEPTAKSMPALLLSDRRNLNAEFRWGRRLDRRGRINGFRRRSRNFGSRFRGRRLASKKRPKCDKRKVLRKPDVRNTHQGSLGRESYRGLP